LRAIFEFTFQAGIRHRVRFALVEICVSTHSDHLQVVSCPRGCAVCLETAAPMLPNRNV